MPRKGKMDEEIKIRLTKNQLAALDRLCEQNSLNRSEMIRTCIRYSGHRVAKNHIKKFVETAIDMPDPFDEQPADERGTVAEQVKAMCQTVDDSDRELAEQYAQIECEVKQQVEDATQAMTDEELIDYLLANDTRFIVRGDRIRWSATSGLITLAIRKRILGNHWRFARLINEKTKPEVERQPSPEAEANLEAFVERRIKGGYTAEEEAEHKRWWDESAEAIEREHRIERDADPNRPNTVPAAWKDEGEDGY